MCISRSACLTLCNPMDCSPPGSPVHGILRQAYWSGLPFPSPRYLPVPGMEPRSPALQADSLPAEPQGSPRILEWVAYPFSSGSSRPQELNQGLLHCRQILYQLSYEGSPEPGIIDPRSPPSPSSSPSSSPSPFHHLFHHRPPPLPHHHRHHHHHQHPNTESGDGDGNSGEGCRDEFSGHQGLQPRC